MEKGQKLMKMEERKNEKVDIRETSLSDSDYISFIFALIELKF